MAHESPQPEERLLPMKSPTAFLSLRRSQPLLAIAFALSLCPGVHAGIDGGFDGQRTGVEDDRTAPNAFLGKGGKGWKHNWIFDRKGDGASASGAVLEEQPLEGHGGKYVRIATTAGSEEGGITLYRRYEDYEDVARELPRTVRFFFRMESDLAGFVQGNGVNFSEDSRLREIGGSWWISAVGGSRVGAPVPGRSQEALVWCFYGGQPGENFSSQGFVRSGMALEQGVTYQFEITVDPAKRRWKATISNGKETVSSALPERSDDPWLSFRYQDSRSREINPSGYLLFHTSLSPGNTLEYSLAGLKLTSAEETMP